MTRGLSGGLRGVLEGFVQSARSWVEEDVWGRLEGPFGVGRDGGLVPVESLGLSAAGLAVRSGVVGVLEFLRSEGESGSGAVERLVREVAFTHVNRLVAVRVAEAQGLLPETVGRGLFSSGFRDFSELAPGVAETEWGRFGLFVRLCADELASDVPALFDPRNPLLDVELSEPVLRRLVEAMVATDDEVWSAPDTLGWAYQFFNTGEERREMRESAAPRTSRELAVRNQFFTPSYVVEFLVQNGLGAYLAAGFPGLADELPLLVEVPSERAEVDLAEVSVLDPACGSGHFLLGAYDVLERAYELAGVDASEAAPQIVSSLWGIDIDPRATQIAQAAVIFRARRHCRGPLPAPNVICARALPAGAEIDALVAGLPSDVGRAVRAIAEELVDAPLLGPLLKIEERLGREVRDIFGTGTIDGTLAEAAADSMISEAESEVLEALGRIADAITSTPAQRLFAAEARDAVRFVEAMTRRYTAVLMNPPFGEPIPQTKTYLKTAYPWIPSTSDVFALFVGRGIGMTVASGSVGAITSRVGFFLGSFEDWRTEVLRSNDLGPVADLGEGVMEQAMVEAAAYVMRRRTARVERVPVFIRALTAADRSAAIAESIAAYRSGEAHPRIHTPDLSGLDALAGAPLAYWVDPGDLEQLSQHEAFEPSRAVVRVGLQTGDDFRFVRAWWEVRPERLTRDPELVDGRDERWQLGHGARWAPIVKGGTSQPWFSPNTLVVDWEDDGRRLRSFTDASGKLRSRPQNTEFYFRPGFSWTRRAPRLVPYVVPTGCIPSVSRYQAFPHGDPYEAIGIAASNVATAYCRFYGEKFLWPNFLVDNLKSLPVPVLPDAVRVDLATFVEEAVDARRRVYEGLEPYREFVSPAPESPELEWGRSSLLGDDLETRIARAYGLSDGARRRLELDLHEALEMLGDDGGDEAGAEADERLEEPWGQRLVSYLVGVAFGRWDVRIGISPSTASRLPNAFAPPPVAPPGMLMDPSRAGHSSGVDYPLEVAVDGILVDQNGHRWDIESRVVEAGRIFLGRDPDFGSLLSELMRKATLGGYLRRLFFADHLGTYTKGRRRAPIYWQLQVPSKAWGVWLYAPRLSREMLFAVVREAEQRLRLAEQQIGHLQREAEDGSGGRSAAVVAKELEAEQRLAVELVSFRSEAERIANLGWEPDLDDGMVLNAAPLADLFPAWKEAARYRDELRAGKYEWATVARYANQL